MNASHPLLKFKLGHYQIVTRRLAEFSAQKAAREALESEQRIARPRLRYSKKPIVESPVDFPDTRRTRLGDVFSWIL